MPQIQLNAEVFDIAQRRAAAGGYASVDDYVADVVANDLPVDPVEDTPNLDHLFTPERFAHIDNAMAEIQAGNFFTTEQAREELAKRREEWLRKSHG